MRAYLGSVYGGSCGDGRAGISGLDGVAERD